MTPLHFFSAVFLLTIGLVGWGLQRTFPHDPIASTWILFGVLIWSLSRKWPVITLSLLLGSAPVFPILYLCVTNRSDFPYALWLAGMGLWAMASRSAFRWHLPGTWQGPVTLWCTLMTIGWFRGVYHFTRGFSITILEQNPPVNRVGTPTLTALVLTSYATAVLIGGFLFVNRMKSLSLLDASTAETDDRFILFRRPVLADAVAAGLVVGGVIALYQTFVDITFLNQPYWIHLKRVTGGTLDANVHGILNALLGPLVMIGIGPRIKRFQTRFYSVALLWTLTQVMISGSRSALLLLVIWGIILGFIRFRDVFRRPRRTAIIVLVILGVLGVALQLPVNTPLHRVMKHLRLSPKTFIQKQMQARLYYGQAALFMFHDAPLVGTGPGRVHLHMPDYGWDRLKRWLQPDNALNWYLHQLVILGLLGCLGWVPLVWHLGRRVIHVLRHPDTHHQQEVAGLILAFGVVSLFGVHTFNAALMIAFWTGVASLLERPDKTVRLSDEWKFLIILAGVTMLVLGIQADRRVFTRAPNAASSPSSSPNPIESSVQSPITRKHKKG